MLCYRKVSPAVIQILLHNEKQYVQEWEGGGVQGLGLRLVLQLQPSLRLPL